MVKYLPSEHMGLGLILRTYVEKPGVVVCTCIPSAEEAEIEPFLGMLAIQGKPNWQVPGQ